MASSFSPFAPGMVVFGAGGFIGAATARALEEAGQEVTSITSRQADLSDPQQVDRLRLAFPPGGVWVLAAARNPGYLGDVLAANSRIAECAARLIGLAPPAGVVFLSSIDVYGRSGLELPLHEHSPRNPQSPYAESKCIAEDCIQQACNDTDVPLLTLRLPGVYGPEDPHAGPVRSFINAALRGEPLRVQGDGEQQRDLLYVEDIPRIVEAWMRSFEPGVYNAVTGRSVTLNHLIATINDCAGRALPVEYDPAAPQFDIAFARPRLLRALPGLQLTPIEEGLRRTYARVQRLHHEGLAHVE